MTPIDALRARLCWLLGHDWVHDSTRLGLTDHCWHCRRSRFCRWAAHGERKGCR